MHTFYEDCPFHVGGSAEASFVFPPISFQLRDTFGAQVQVKVEFLIWVSLHCKRLEYISFYQSLSIN